METQKEIDEKIRLYIRKQKISLPDSYKKRVNALIEEYGEERGKMPIWKKKYPRIVLAALAVCILAMGGTAVYGSVNYVRERMEEFSGKEKTKYYSELQDSQAQADHFSRELTASEQERIKQLERKYQSEGLYPEDTVTEIDNAEEVDDQKICFLAKSSTFYLPERELTDEELLQIIDFYYVREHSLSELGQAAETQGEYDVAEKLTEQEAICRAGDMVDDLFGVSTDQMKMESEHEAGTDGESAFTTEYVTFSDGQNKYYVAIDMQNGKIGSVERDLLTDQGIKDRYSDEIKVEEGLFREQYKSIETYARKFSGSDSEWIMAEAVYAADEENTLKNGILKYYFMTDDDKVYAVSYSYATDQVYRICFFTKEGMQAKRDMEKKQMEGGRWKMIGLKIDDK